MPVDLAPPSGYEPAVSKLVPQAAGAPRRRPKILVFDSGLGGLTVFAEIAELCRDANFTYAADDAGFPYGAWQSAELVSRVVGVVGELIRDRGFDLAVIACNTASTLVLPDLRAAFPDVPFVGTVPAIKPAAQLSRSKMISVLATPGTVARDYTRGLIDAFAGDCRVTLVGSQRLASLAEAAMTGGAVADAEIAAEIAPCFVAGDGGCRTDSIVLACTHYPLLADRFAKLAPWPVSWIDPAPAIARRVEAVLRGNGFDFGAVQTDGGGTGAGRAVFTSGRPPLPALVGLLSRFGLAADPAAALT